MEYSLKEELFDDIFRKVKLSVLPSENNGYRSRFLQSNILLYCVILLLVLKVITISVSVNFPSNIFFADITKSSLENFANQTRQSEGLPALLENQKLNQAAQAKAENMVQNQYFSHVSPTGVTPWFWFLQAGYKYRYAGENLAIGFYDSKEVYDAWLNSPSHKANILNPNYTEVGTAVLTGFGSSNTIVVVQEFGSQLPIKKVPDNSKTVASQPATKTQSSTTNTQASTTATAEPTPKAEVLSQSTDSQSLLAPADGNSKDSVPSRMMNFVIYNYDSILQDIAYGVSLIVIAIVLMLIFSSSNISFRKELVFRSVVIIVLLTVATLVNSHAVISLIPHQVII